MTWSRRRSSCSSGLGAALVAAAIVLARATPAAAQACCAGGALLTPTRLAVQEDYAVGLQMQARSNVGSFNGSGAFAASSGSSQVLEQDVAASIRLFRRAQVGMLLPTVQTHHATASDEGWGGGLGDVTVTARYDFLLAADEVHWPGIALLAGGTFPTGTSPDEAGPDATGGGTYNATLGLGLEKVAGHFYSGLNGWVTYRYRSNPGPVPESFGLRWTAMAIAGWVFDNEAAVALYGTLLEEGDATVDGKVDPTTGLRLTTVGAAGVMPIRELWRLQGAAFSDVMISSFGRNEIGGFGLSLSLVRAFL
jgi:hypothetical protein